MLALTNHMRIVVFVAPVDFRAGIDGLAARVRAQEHDAFAGTVFVFRNRTQTALKLLCYDGQGFWLCHKRLSSGRFRHWPGAANEVIQLLAHELAVLVAIPRAAAVRANV